MSGSREVANVMRPSLPDAAESPEESGVKEHFHDNHTSDLKISTPENLPDCIQQKAVNLSLSNLVKRNLKVDICKLQLTSEQLKEIKRKRKLPPLIPLSDQGMIDRHQMSGHEEMPEAKSLNVSIFNDADVDPAIELINDGGNLR